jgi:PAS domain S-box-containing protein
MEPVQPTKVLLLWNKQRCRGALAACLKQAGHKVLESKADLPRPLEILREQPDLVVLELATLDPGTPARCRQARMGLHGDVLPLILISRLFSSGQSRAEGMRAGADACLADSVEPAELAAQVGRLAQVRRVEIALRESEERFRQATEAMDGLVYEWHVPEGIALRSVGIVRFLGWLPHEARDSRWWPEHIHPEDRARVEQHFAHAATQRALGCQQEYRMRHRDGHYLWVWDSNRITYGPDGGPVRVVGCVVSIDALKRTEEGLRRAREELLHANENLELKVQERTSRLQDTVAELERFSYSIAHDMRAPLRTMHSFSTFLREEYGQRLDSVAHDYLRRIEVAATRLDVYLRDLLRYGRVGGGEFHLKTVDATALLDEILATYPNFQPSLCSIEVARPLPAVRANASALTQVFSNLLGNAVKFSKPGGLPKVRVWGQLDAARVRFFIEDEGIGIEKSAHERIFGMFQQLHPAGTFEGTGIGLAIVRKAAERMGGAVGVESEPGRGSRFWVELKAPAPSASAPG